MKGKNEVRTRQGVVFGDQQRLVPELDGRQLFVGKHFPAEPPLELDASNLPTIVDLKVHSKDSTDFRAFDAPQLLIKQGFQASLGRFQARIVSGGDGQGVICNKSYISATGPLPLMKAACLTYNSLVATYFMQLRSGRMAAYRPEANVHEILDVPLPPPEAMEGTSSQTPNDIDQAVFDGFGLKEAERILIEDMAAITIPDFRGDRPSPGSIATHDITGREDILTLYCETFFKVLRAGFGATRKLGASIFASPADEPVPYRLVAIQLLNESAQEHGIRVEPIGHTGLIDELRRLSLTHATGSGRLLGQRLARFYDASSGTPTIFMLKPDATRYWTRSMALNDADQVAVDLFQWTAASRSVRG